LYRHEFAPDVRVHLYTIVGGDREPVAWSRSYPAGGPGRVLYFALGHTVHALRHPQSLAVLRRGLHWVCGQSRAESRQA
jgi:type 1 glutamine amidotransferase